MQRLRIAAAFAETRWVTRAGLPRTRFDAWQARRITRWLRDDVPGVGFYDGRAARLADLPVIDKAVVMDRFQDFNRAGITAEAGWAALGGEIAGVSIGASTGTSGNRALYAVTAAERARWLGTILAKALPDILWRAERVAVILPQSSALYDEARATGRIALRFFDLREGPETWTRALEAFAPTTIVGPPRMLRWLAEGARLAPDRVYSGAETLDPVDRAAIEAALGLRLGQIYMATEGLFAVTCAEGRLHLAEDANHFELEPVGDLVSPVVSSFRRRFQILARYRMNDLLRMGQGGCACGSPLRVVDEVVGRMDDVFRFGPLIVTPDVMRNAVLNASRAITDFRVLREADGRIVLVLPPEVAGADAAAALAALEGLLRGRGISVAVALERRALGFEAGRKLRRVENRYRGGNADAA